MSLFQIPKGYTQTRLERPTPTTLRPFECADCGWQGHLEMAWDGEGFAPAAECPAHAGTPMPEWARAAA